MWAAIVFDGVAKSAGVVVSLTLFAIGVIVFVWGLTTAARRSRRDVMSVAELYFLVGPAIPAGVRRLMNSLLLIQFTVGIVTAVVRSSTPAVNGIDASSPGSSLAFGVLVPVFGLGLNGLWASRHGRFRPRPLRDL